MKIYYECYYGSAVPFDSFVSDAVIGAYNLGWECIPFNSVDEIKSFDKSNTMVVGCVEVTQELFKRYIGKELPPINYQDTLSEYMGAKLELVRKTDLKTPCFIKPTVTKAFTGFVLTGDLLLDNGYESMLEDYKEDFVYTQKVLNIVSEYRVYVQRGRVIGIKHYIGDPYSRPSKVFVEQTVKKSEEVFKELSYTLDFGILKDGSTVLIEANDAWSIGNYGIAPDTYFSFIKERWFQIMRTNS